MKNTFPYQLITLFFIIFMVCFTLAFYALGWTEPTADPPAGNIDVPVNVGAITQNKLGGFVVEGIFQADGGSGDDVLTVTFVAGEGRVGIGTENPTEELHVVGEIKAFNGDICTNLNGGVCLSTVGGGAAGVTSISAGSGITLSPNPITSTGTINVNTGSVATTGLEIVSSQVRLMDNGCSAGEVLKRNSTNTGWECVLDAGVGLSCTTVSATSSNDIQLNCPADYTAVVGWCMGSAVIWGDLGGSCYLTPNASSATGLHFESMGLSTSIWLRCCK